MTHRRIQEVLSGIEAEHGVRILYACESGSRGWGFDLADSDWDVRFIYCHPRDWYLSVDEGRDVIELPIDDLLDVNGWDLRKSLRLMRKSNPVLLEWLSSPIVYREDVAAMAAYRSLAQDFYQPTACLHCGFNRSMQRLVQIFQRVFHSLAFFLDADLISSPPH